MNINQNNINGNNVVNVGVEQRHLDDNSKQTLLNLLSKSEKMDINAPLGDPEALTLANEIKALLINKGYTVEGVTLCAWAEPLEGVVIVNKLTDGVRKINVGHNR